MIKYKPSPSVIGQMHGDQKISIASPQWSGQIWDENEK